MARLHPAAAHWDDADPALGRPLHAGAFRPETAVLAAITSGYEDARARIIAADPPSPDGPRHAAPAEAAAPGWAPTVPVELGSWQPRPPEQLPPHPAPGPRAPFPAGRWRDLFRRRPR